MVDIVDDEIQELEKEIERLELENARVHARTTCENLMNKYQYYHMRCMRTEETHLFALNSPGATVEMLWGIYDGPESVLRWKKSEGYGKPPQKGVFPMHLMTTPIIEVAKDGETARGLWLMYGAETFKNEEGKVLAYWAAGQFAMDFIKENGEWKIWKYNTTGLIYSPFDKGWHKENREVLESMVSRERLEEEKPDRPASFAWMWGPDEYFQNIPPVPLPYDTWDNSLACIPVPGARWEIKKFD
jgi:hypothetical protein